MSKVENDTIPPIRFVAAGETPEEKKAVLASIKPSPGYPTAAQMIAEAIEKRSDLTLMDFSPQKVSIRFQIDGIWHNMPPMDRETGDYMMATLKQMAGLNYRERRARQEGEFVAEYLRRKNKCRLVSQGVPNGERIAIYIDIPKPKIETLEQMGMRTSMLDSLKPILGNTKEGLVLVSALPGEGYTALWRGVFGACDRFMRDYYVIEEASRVEPDVINVETITFDESKGEHAFTPIPQLLLREPNFIAFAEIANGAMLNKVCGMSQEQDLPVMTRIEGKHATDALLRVLVHKPDVQLFAETIKAVINMRLIRKLCEDCKVAFRPNPMLLQKLGLPAGRVGQLYKPFQFQPGMLDEQGEEIEVCKTCQGVGYKDLTGIFELLVVNDAIREALIKKPRLDHLMAVAQQQRHISLQQEGVVIVARGTTSIEELQRVLTK